MTHMTEQEYLELQRRIQITQDSIDQSVEHSIDHPEQFADLGPESALQSKIKVYCKGKGWPILSFPRTADVKKFLPPGYPDVVLSLPYGHTLYLELKAARGIWKEKQQLIAGQLNQLGHQYFVVRSYKKFLEIVEGVTRRE